VNDSSVKKHDVFVSYAWGAMDGSPRVMKMVEHSREKHELEAFLDKDHLGKGDLFLQLSVGMKRATLFIPFWTKK